MNQLDNLKENLINKTKEEINRKKSDIKDYSARINNYITVKQTEIRNLEILEARLKTGESFFEEIIKSIEAIKSFKYVKSVIANENDIEIHTTDDMRAHTEDGYELILGGLVIYLGISDSRVEIYNIEKDMGGYGYWTKNDPHPHVNGENGKPCLGGIESHLMMAISEYKYDIAATMILEFLQSVNISDPAGAKYTGWDRYDSCGNYYNAEDGMTMCSICEETFDEDNIYTCNDCNDNICDGCSIYISGNDYYVCENCYEANYNNCSNCGDNYSSDSMYYHVNGSVFCRGCLEEGDFVQCSECDKYMDADNVVMVEEDSMCYSCYSRMKNNGKIFTCKNCEELFYTSSVGVNEDYCEECCDELCDDECNCNGECGECEECTCKSNNEEVF